MAMTKNIHKMAVNKKAFVLWLACAVSVAAHSVEFKGSPTKIQINEDKSLLLLLNDDYDFSVYSVAAKDGKLFCEQKIELGKKDVSGNSYELDDSYAEQAKADCLLQKILAEEKNRLENKGRKQTGGEIGFYIQYSFYLKSQDSTCCVYNFEDGKWVYETRILFLENGKVFRRKLKKRNVRAMYDLNPKEWLAVFYDFKKDVTRVSIVKDLKTLK